MGAAAARKLAGLGYRIAILSPSGKGEALAEELGGVGVTGSNRSNDDLQSLVDKVMAAWGRIDALVNSAGHGPRAPILDITDDDWHTGMEVYFLCVGACGPPGRADHAAAGRRRHRQRLDLRRPSSRRRPTRHRACSAPVLAAYTKLFADKYAADNIRMNNVLPGYIDSFPEQEEFRATIPMQRYGTVGRSRRPSLSWPRRAALTSPARISGSTAASRVRCNRDQASRRRRRFRPKDGG